MSGVFQNIDPAPPHRPASLYPPPRIWREWGVNSSEDARHCSVLYICKYFVLYGIYLHYITLICLFPLFVLSSLQKQIVSSL
jgi:hypothetical protein